MRHPLPLASLRRVVLLLCTGLLVAGADGARGAITLTDTTNLSLTAHQTESGADTTENPDVTGGAGGPLIPYTESGSFTCCGGSYLGDNLDDGDVGAGNPSDGTYAIPDADGVAPPLVLDFGAPRTVAGIVVYNGYTNRDDGTYTLEDDGANVLGAWTIATASNGTNAGADSFWLSFPTPVTTSSLTLTAVSSDASDTVSYREIQVRAPLLPTAGARLYTASWVAESWGNDAVGGTLESQYFSVVGLPMGHQCNTLWPRCPFQSTPVSGVGKNFSALGTVCTPITAWASARPAKGATSTFGGQPAPQAVRYRNPVFFTSGGAPNLTGCAPNTTVGGSPATVALTTNSPLRGGVMKGAPLTGGGTATTTGGGSDFSFKLLEGAFKRTTVGDFPFSPPWVYRYLYATFRNSTGTFGNGLGPGSFDLPYVKNGTQARVVVQQGPNKFGGVMRLLGQLTTKACYFRNGGCSLGGMNLLYEQIGATAYTSGGVVTQGDQFLYSAQYYHSVLMQTSTVMAVGSRFPWTTGTVTVTATGRGPHKTIERREGYDARTAGGLGKMQLVTPILTHWLQPAVNYETGGVGILKIEFVPEPGVLVALVSGLAMLAVLYRIRRP